MIIKTHLVSGAGNTFHILNYNDPLYALQNWVLAKQKEIATTICNQKKADGFIFLESNFSTQNESKSKKEYKWTFFNNDGSDAEMCGNATRCVGFYIKNILNSESNDWSLLTIAGPIKIQFVSRECYQITMTPVQQFKSNLGFYCDTGVPHLVIEVDDFQRKENLMLKAKQLRAHIDFKPRGTNVTYVVFDNEFAKLKAISYERGVEGFTAACGTGAVAAAFFNLTKRGVKQTQVEMPGGTLIIDLTDLNKPTMTGPAILLGSYSYEVII